MQDSRRRLANSEAKRLSGRQIMGLCGFFLACFIGSIWYSMENNYHLGFTLVGAAKKEILKVREQSVSTEGRLIYVEGPLVLEDDSLSDPDLMISFKGFFVVRRVEMYLWQKSLDKKDTYASELSSSNKNDKFDRVWSSSDIYSFNYPHRYQNPSWDRRLEERVFLNMGPASVKGFEIPSSLLTSLTVVEAVSPHTLKLQRHLQNLGLTVYIDHQYVYLASRERNPTELYYPEVGDYRITYVLMPNRVKVAVIGEQRHNKLVSWRNELLLLSDTALDCETLLGKLSLSPYLMIIFRVVFIYLFTLALLFAGRH
jgi:hypothetical protein